MTFVDALGYAAACLTTFSFVPQAWHTFRTRDVSQACGTNENVVRQAAA